MIAAVVTLAIAGLGFAAVAVILGIRNGRLAGDLIVTEADRDRLREVLDELTDNLADVNRRHAELERSHKRRIQDIYAQIRKSPGGAAALGSVVVADIERLLSPPAAADDHDDPHG